MPVLSTCFRKILFLMLLPFTWLFQNSFAQINTTIKIMNVPVAQLKIMVDDNPKLISELNEKFLSGKDTLTDTQLFTLYYGSAFDDRYAPYSEDAMIAGYNKFITAEQFKEAATYCITFIRKNPGYLKGLLLAAMAYEDDKDNVNAKKMYRLYYSMLKVILFSGNGTSQKTAYVVRSVSDEYLVMRHFKRKVLKQSLITDSEIPYDLLEFESIEDKTQTGKTYFNVYLPFDQTMKGLFDK